MMKCHNCNSEIESDSLYCDQCGAKIYICPKCRIPGKGEGKRCGNCGTKLVAAAELSPAENGPQNTPGGPASPETPKTAAAPTKLVCRSMGITLVLNDGALIGRVHGPYAPLLSKLQYVSARHAIIHRDGDRWIIEDTGSRNGTAVNGQWCYSPLPFAKGDTVRIANSYDFIAE